ncbi:hypothetical protein [Anaerotruncus colihominis]|uniref:hypothetical protein n=1 Tax=Anaerotruncus colihominis TaxID=169435 RepID=UPI0029427E13|nr:hypothetical protein [Anaerotruncus colihominis]
MEENKKDVLPLEGEPLTTPQISEPVVNALAAALNKIETYVPTQYINDGPPDIDAEHLNHAEQAIMRVTNLANGAADAISALQSQVTQLNSDFKARDASMEIGQVERGAYIYLRNKVTNNLLMLRLNEDDKKLVFNSEVDGQWGTETEFVTKSDLDKGQFVVKVEENIQKVITSQSDIVRGTLPSQMKDCAYAAIGFSDTIDNELSIVVDGNSIIVSPKKTNNAVTINWFQFN